MGMLRISLLARFTLLILLAGQLLSCALFPLPDEDALQQRMQAIIDYVDSPEYAKEVSWGEHIVLSYQLAQGRSPTPLEFYLLNSMRDEDLTIMRSTVLSVALRGAEQSPSWSQLESFLAKVRAKDFKVDRQVKADAKKLDAVPSTTVTEELRLRQLDAPDKPRIESEHEMPQPETGVQYNTYFGYLHAHSGLSDGRGTPNEAYAHARDEGGLDFFALTDHAEYLSIWPWENKWNTLKNAADSHNNPGSYVTLWGFEWSNPLLGHVNVINSDDFTDTFETFDIRDLYDWIAARPNALGRFNHPGRYNDLEIEFFHLHLYQQAVQKMVGIETWNRSNSFDQYYYKCNWRPFCVHSYWDHGNTRGWYLGALGGQDNHSRDWGTRNDLRTAVLAEELTRAALLSALESRRFYATEDKDLKLDFRVQGYPMGSRLVDVEREFEINVCDDSGDTFHEVRLYRNGALLKTMAVSGNCVNADFSDSTRSGSDYYYVIVQQNDDGDGNGRNDEAISAPIWIN